MQTVDILIGFISFTLLTWLLAGPTPFTVMKRGETVSLVVIYLVLILVSIEFLSLICWFIFQLFPILSEEGILRYLVDLETKMFLLTGCLAPLITIIFLFSWIVKFFAHYGLLKRFYTLFTPDIKRFNDVCLAEISIHYLLVFPVVFSLLVTFYPYLPGLNTDMHPIGVDVPLYKGWLEGLENEELLNVFTKSFFEHPGRPLSLFIMYLVKCMGGFSALVVVQFFPIILSPVLVLSVYFFMHRAGVFNGVSFFAAFLSVSSFHVSVGMYAGFLSNWMALIELYLFAGFFFGFLKRKSYLRIIAALLLSIALLFTHSWTWGMFMGILMVYLLLIYIKSKPLRWELSLESRILFAIIGINVLVGIIRNYALGWTAGDFETLKVARAMVSSSSLTSFWGDTLYTFFHTMYGFFVNPIALLLAVLGSAVIIFDEKPVNRYLISWLMCSSIFFVLSSGWSVKSRILFNLPLPVFEAVGLAVVGDMIQKVFRTNKGVLIKNLVTLFVLLVSLNYAFRCSFAMSQLTYDLF
ncbi:MAG: hypothetical protein DRN95_09345 [Candidatus Hydrothermarchaeota archaeon]|nr:MAG: hypothetical protein DRN95_09345 [Candidatus Hydrothermarchaeota archaeon]